jgi:hypothetical protein
MVDKQEVTLWWGGLQGERRICPLSVVSAREETRSYQDGAENEKDPEERAAD